MHQPGLEDLTLTAVVISKLLEQPISATMQI